MYFEFRFFFEELWRFRVLCKRVIFGINLITFRGIFVQIKVFFYEHIISKLHFTPQNESICVPNRRKAIKKTSSGLIEKFTIKKSNSNSELLF